MTPPLNLTNDAAAKNNREKVAGAMSDRATYASQTNAPSGAGTSRSGFGRSRAAALALALGVILALAALGCYNNNTGETRISDDIHFKLPAFPETGSNKVQVFTEMHYQPSYRSQEGPRLDVPPGAVPITGAEVLYTSVEEYHELGNPGGDVNNGAALYAVNCTVCHGAELDGQGKVMTYGPNMAPANLKIDPTAARTDGELYGIISFGGNTGFSVRVPNLDDPTYDNDRCVGQAACPMPEFRKLLTEQERWDLVAYLRAEQGR